MKCYFCNGEFPEEELETISGALRDNGDPEPYHVCETCAAWIDDNTGRWWRNDGKNLEMH